MHNVLLTRFMWSIVGSDFAARTCKESKFISYLSLSLILCQICLQISTFGIFDPQWRLPHLRQTPLAKSSIIVHRGSIYWGGGGGGARMKLLSQRLEPSSKIIFAYNNKGGRFYMQKGYTLSKMCYFPSKRTVSHLKRVRPTKISRLYHSKSFKILDRALVYNDFWGFRHSRWTAVKQVHCPSCILGDAEWRPSKWEN